ncbi:MAG: hypothetical protein ABR518_07610, partial [Actinomycetota bacterium]
PDTLQSLVEKSLVRHSGDRFWMLETIREYAAERLEESPDGGDVRRRHAEYFLVLADETDPGLGLESAESVERVDHDLDNIRGALDHLEASGDNERALRLAAAVCWFWSLQGHLVEGEARLNRLIPLAAVPDPLRARALVGAADIAIDLGDHDAARARAHSALDLYRSLEDRRGVAYCLVVLGLVSAFERDWASGRDRLEESARICREVGDRFLALQATRRLAWMYWELGDVEGARALVERNLIEARAVGDENMEAQSLATLAHYALDDGRVEDAVPLLREAFGIHRGRSEVTHRYWGAVVLYRFARALALRRRPAAAALLACAEARLEETEGPVEAWLEEMLEETRAMIHTYVDADTASAAAEQGRTLSPDDAVALALRELA